MGATIALVFSLLTGLPAQLQATGAFDTTEFMLDTASIGHVNWAQWEPAAAFNGENYLVAWKDSAGKIRCSRVAPDGAVLDPAGTVVYNAGASHGPEVSSSGSDFFVVWDAGADYIYGARVSEAGVVLDNIIISHPARGYRYYPRVAYDGTNYLVVWHDTRDGRGWDQYGVYACRISLSGVVLDTQGIKVTAATSILHDSQFPSVASDGQSFLVTWETNVTGQWGVRFSRITPAGVILDTGGVMLNQEGDLAKTPSVAFDGSNYLVTWSGGGGLADIEGRRLTPDGVVLDRTPITVSSAPDVQEQPQVVFDGSNYLAVWQDSRSGSYDIYGARITTAGTVLDPNGFPVCQAENGQEYPGLAAGSRSLLVAWQDRRHSTTRPHIYAALLDSTGTVQGPVIPIPNLVVSYSIQTNPVAAFDGTNYFVVWQDSQPGTTTWDIMGARVTPTGEVLDVPPVRISSVADFQWVPAVAYGGTEYFVTWQDRRFGTSSGWTIYGARVTTSGTLLDTAGILIRRRQGYNIVTPSVAFDGVNFLVLWNQGWTYARFINQAGQFLDSTPFPVNSGEYEKRTPRAVYGADCYMVAWSERSQYNDLSIGTMRLSRFGEQLDTGVVLISASGMLRPSVAWDSVNFLVAWQYGNNSILAGRVAGVGGILPPQSYPVCTGPGQVSYPSVTFDGEDFLAAWQDKRNNNWDIYGAKMNRALTECDTFRICARSKDQTVPVLSSGPGGQVLAAFAGGIDSVGGNPASGQRVWGKLFSKPGPMPPAMLWPPAGYRFFGPPVWFLADTALRGVDSFGFRVFVPDGDTIWSQPTAVPGCTIPDTILTNDSSYRWQCRVRTGYGWSRYSTARQFWVEFGHVAAPEPLSGHRVLALSVRSVSSRESRSVTFRPYGATDGAAIELLDAAGRRVRRIQVNHDGALLWDMKDATGRRVGAGVYFARLTTGRQVLTRRVVLVN